MFETHDSAKGLVLMQGNVEHRADSVWLQIWRGELSRRWVVVCVGGGDEPGMFDCGKVGREVLSANHLAARVPARLRVVKVDTVDCRMILRKLPHAGSSHTDGLCAGLENLR